MSGLTRARRRRYLELGQCIVYALLAACVAYAVYKGAIQEHRYDGNIIERLDRVEMLLRERCK